jgi:hypothetical protein
MPTAKISKKTVDALTWSPPGPPQQFLWDSALKGFGVYILASGKKTYVAQFRLHGRQQRVKIGPHGAITAEQAREEARRILGKVAHGEDPTAERQERRSARTVNQVADEWLSKFVLAFKKPKTASEYRRIVDLHICPALGKTIMRDLSRADVAALRSAMRATPIMANRALATLGSMWGYAAKVGDVQEDRRGSGPFSFPGLPFRWI